MRNKLMPFVLIFTSFFVFKSTILADFTCSIDGYEVNYDSSGKIVSAKKDGKSVEKNLESYFHPKTQSECPTSDEAKISFIDSRRTFYVAGEGETFKTNGKDDDAGSCAGYTDEFSCQENKFYSCIWNVNEFGKYCNTDKLIYIRCGGSFDIPYEAPEIISFIIALLKTAVPIILIFVSLVSLLKSLGAPNEDEIKKAQKSFVRKITAAILAFLVITIVQFVIRKVADSSDSSAVSTCLSCFMNNDCDGAAYYKTNVGGTYLCTELSGSKKTFTCPGNK